MEEINLVTEGIKFMILGMGTVFTFLLMLIGLMIGQAKFIEKYFPEKPKAPVKPAVSVAKTDDKNKIAAVIGAIQMYNK
jgi:oxaloacetate decarboxylase gamma subunit